jgi:hypothetical protein
VPALELFLSLLIMIILVAIARRLAVKKGRSRVAWMWLTAFFGPIPLLVLALLPSRFNFSDKAM